MSFGMNTTVYTKVQTVQDFCAFYDLTWRKDVTGIISQKVFHYGKYADNRFTEKEFCMGDNFIKEPSWNFNIHQSIQYDQ